MRLFEYIKNIFWLLLLVNFAPLLFEGIRKTYSKYTDLHTRIGLITFKGSLSDASVYSKQLNTLFKDTTIKGILVKMECPGGASGTAQSLYQELKNLKKEYPKPVIVVVENICASGAYYIACAADRIIAPGMSLIGSIGVCTSSLFKLKNFIEQFKIEYVPLKAGEYKGTTDPFVPMTEQDKALLQGVLDDSYDQFITDVAESRSLVKDQHTLWGNGKIFSGKQAQILGLIDDLGSMSLACDIMKKQALIDGEIEFVRSSQSSTLWDLLTGKDSDEEDGFTSRLFTHLYAITTSLMHPLH